MMVKFVVVVFITVFVAAGGIHIAIKNSEDNILEKFYRSGKDYDEQWETRMRLRAEVSIYKERADIYEQLWKQFSFSDSDNTLFVYKGKVWEATDITMHDACDGCGELSVKFRYLNNTMED